MKNKITKTAKTDNRQCFDILGIPINIGDRVIFPAGGEMMEGTVTKFGGVRNPVQALSIKNDSGYTKSKNASVLINVSIIREKLPEYQL